MKKRQRNEDPSDIDGYLGPWAPNITSEQQQTEYEQELAKRREQWKLTQSLKKRKLNDNHNKNKNKDDDDDEDEEDDEETIKQKRIKARQDSMALEKTEFHGNDDELYDYQGRTYMYLREKCSKSSSKYYIQRKGYINL